MMQKVIQDASNEEKALVAEEQGAQDSYESLVADMNKAVQAHSAEIAEKTKLSKETSGLKSETEVALIATVDQLEKLHGVLGGLHLDCDYLVKNYNVRQEARAEEIEAIAQ